MNESRRSAPETKWRPLLETMVDELAASGALRSAAIRRSFVEIPRHLFVDRSTLEEIYSDAPIVTKTDPGGRPVSSSSMPSLIANMLEDLDLRPGLRVMEVGAGTGYNAALLGHIVGASGRVVSIDIDSDIVATARTHVSRTGLTNVRVVAADGAHGFPPEAPYDRITVTVGVREPFPAWVAQLSDGGILQTPIWIRGQQLVATFRKLDDRLTSISLTYGGFMRLRGSSRTGEGYVECAGWTLCHEQPETVDRRRLAAALTEATRNTKPAHLRKRDIGVPFRLYLAMHDPRFALAERCDESGRVTSQAVGYVDWDSCSLALLASQRGSDKVELLSHGSSMLVEQLLSHIGRWETMGSVTLSDCRITIEAGSSGVASRDRRSRPGTVVANAYDMVVRFAGMNGAGLH